MAHPEPLLEVFSRYARNLSGDYEISSVLDDLTASAVEVLDAAGAGVTLADEQGRLRFATASSDPVARLERAQEDLQAGPCHDAFRTGTLVLVDDVERTVRWPEYRQICLGVGLRSVAGVPMTWNGDGFGALNVYRHEPGDWSERDVRLAQVLADMATSYVAHASQLHQSRRLNEQLQAALDSRVLIEQAKGLIAGEQGITLGQAFEELRRHARDNSVSLREVAAAVVQLGLRPGTERKVPLAHPPAQPYGHFAVPDHGSSRSPRT